MDYKDNTAPAEKPVKKKKEKRARAWELDALRGLAILLVAWDHTMYDLAYLFGYEWRSSGTTAMRAVSNFAKDYMLGDLRYIFWPVFVFMFFIVSGLCTTFSRNNFIRGLRLAGVALGLTLVTYIAELVSGEAMTILFGVLHCMAVCILLYALISFLFGLLEKAINKNADHSKITKWFLPAFCLITGIIVLVLNSVYNTPVMEVTTLSSIPSSDNPILGLFIFIREWWAASSDYFPLLPYLGYFMLGAAVAPILYPKKKSLMPKLDGKWNYILTIPGRYSIFVYLGSQVLAIGIVALITYVKLGSLYF